MKDYDVITINLTSRANKSVYGNIDLGGIIRTIEISEDNIYDFVENPSINKNMWLFAVDDKYPAVKLHYHNGILSVGYIDKNEMTYNILDRSPKGIMKWLYRILEDAPIDKLFKINRETIYNE